MSLRDLREKFKYDVDFIYEGLLLDLSYYLKQFMLEKGLNKNSLRKEWEFHLLISRKFLAEKIYP